MTLKKLSQTRYVEPVQPVPGSPAVPGSPGSPGTPPTPGYFKNVTVAPLFKYSLNFGGQIIALSDIKQPIISIVFQDYRSQSPPPVWVENPSTTKLVYVPPSPGTPPTPPTPGLPATPGVLGQPGGTVTDLKFGWNASAVSKQTASGNVRFNVSVDPSSLGIVVGLNNQNEGSSYQEIEFGLYFTQAKALVYENGAQKTSVQTVSITDVFSIVRSGGVVTYLKNDVLFYTSGHSSFGPVFIDSSLYSGGDQIVFAELVILNESGSSSGYMRPLRGFATDKPYAVSDGYFSPLSGIASTTIAVGGTGVFAPLSSLGSNYPYNGADSTLKPVGSSARTGIGDLTPTYAIASSVMSEMLGQSYMLTGEIGSVTNGALRSLQTLSTNRPYGESRGFMQPVQALSVEIPAINNYANLKSRAAFVVANGHDSTGENRFTYTASVPTVSAYGGSNARLVGPTPALSVSGTFVSWGFADLVAPSALVAAAGRVNGVGGAALTIGAFGSPTYLLVGYCGAVASVTVNDQYVVVANGKSGAVGNATLTLPLYDLVVSGKAENYGSADLLMPSPKLAGSAVAWLVAPNASLVAIGSAVVTVSYEAYALNLNHRPRGNETPTDELTRFTNYPFDKIIRYQNSYFGVNSTGLYLLEGTTDNGAPISYEVRTHVTDFNEVAMKTVVSSYFGGSLGAAETVTLYGGKTGANAYNYTTPRGTNLQNYRQKFGKGIKDRYYALGVSGADAFELSSIDFEISTLTRRI